MGEFRRRDFAAIDEPGQIALVTGASCGMGRATALARADAGAHVIVHYGRNAGEAKRLVDQIRAAAGRADAVDLATPDGAHTLAAQMHDLVGDHLDIIVANAGISKAAAIEDMTVQDLDNSSPLTFARLTSLFSSCCRS